MKETDNSKKEHLNDEREEAIKGLEDWLDPVMVVLGLAWLILLVLDMTRGLGRFLEITNYAIWIIFIIDFAVRFFLAPRKGTYLRKNWLTAVSLAVPALRMFRALRAVRFVRYTGVTRTTRMVRMIGSMNRGMKTLGRTMHRRGLVYIVLLTILFTYVGSAGMYAFEKDSPSGGFRDYGEALWWTAMIMTTMGSQYWPETTEGRFLCLLLATYAFAIFGYVTASIAAFFIDLDKDNKKDRVVDKND